MPRDVPCPGDPRPRQRVAQHGFLHHELRLVGVRLVRAAAASREEGTRRLAMALPLAESLHHAAAHEAGAHVLDAQAHPVPRDPAGNEHHLARVAGQALATVDRPLDLDFDDVTGPQPRRRRVAHGPIYRWNRLRRGRPKASRIRRATESARIWARTTAGMRTA